ncbi:MAG: hypothetical protein IJW79_10175 [Clostridia bacterium]|nr:hypothetical protein [Clostridia bacterium]
MNISETDSLTQNIINCSADIERCSAEIDLFISESILKKDFSNFPVIDIKNDILQEYNSLTRITCPSKYESVRQKLYIAEQISHIVKTPFAVKNDIDSSSDPIKIFYWNANNYAREAFDVFSKIFALYEENCVESFNAVCENIVDEKAFGIIPIVNSTDGKLTSFYRLIDKFDLKIISACNIENTDGNGFTRYALIGKNLIDFADSGNKSIELLINDDVSDLAISLGIIGGSVREITSIPSLHNKNDALNYVTVNLKSEDIYTLWWYLYIFGGDVDLIGIYSEI